MPGSMTNYLEKKLLDHALGKTAYPMPTVYVGLLTTVPTENGTLNELTGGGYARVPLVIGAATDDGSSNSQNISFPSATANWGSVVAVGLFDSQSVGTGNLLLYGTLDAAKTIATSDQFVIPTAALNITLD